jgi:NADH:ubiquinone oxidoreductase subunit E
MILSICVGSSCHLKGSYQIINMIKEKLETEKLENIIELKAAFCMGNCTNGVSIKIDEVLFSGIKPDNFENFFQTEVVPRLR